MKIYLPSVSVFFVGLILLKSLTNEQSYPPITCLSFSSETKIASILRDGKMIFPGGNDAIKINDSVMVVTTASSIEDFDDMIEFNE